MSAPDVWALEAALVVQQEEAIHAALAPLGRTLMDDVQAYIGAERKHPWMMVDAQRVSHEVFDTTELQQLCDAIVNECRFVQEKIASSQFVESQKYPATPAGVEQWTKDKQTVIDNLTPTIEMLTQGARSEDVVSVVRNLMYAESTLQQWGTLPETLRNNLQALRNTLTNFRNVDGLKQTLENTCRSSIEAIRAIVNDVERVCGIDPNNAQDIRRLLNLPVPAQCENFARSGEAKGLKNLLETWLDQLKVDARPTHAFDPAVLLQKREKTNTAPEQPIASAIQTPRNRFAAAIRRLFK